LFEIEIVLIDDDDTDPKEIVDGDGINAIDGAAVQLNVNMALDRAGSLLDRTRVSTNGVDALDPVGGVHAITIVDAELLAKFVIGSDPDEIENHDPIENDPDCETLSDAGPVLLT